MTIVISGASGQLGRLAAWAVLEKVDPADVVLVSRTPEALGEFAVRGVQLRGADLDDPASLPAAFSGGDRLLLISTDAVGRRVVQHGAAVVAAATAGVQATVYTSLINPSDSNPVAVAAEHRETEELLRTSGMEWTFLRNSIYAEMLLPEAAGAVATGRIATNAGLGEVAYVSREDCAAAAAAVLTSDGHDGRAYDITGPKALNVEDLARIYSEVGEVVVEIAMLEDDAWVANLVEAGVPAPAARDLATFGIGARRGYLAAVSTSVQDLTGRPPKSVLEVLRAHRAELAAAAP